MNRAEAIAAFEDYVSGYDPQNPMIRLKIDHTYRVAALAGRIARSLALGELEDFAWLLGLLHDIGRFEQVRRYGTFTDARSVDHAELGADILFCDNLIERFPIHALPEGWRETAETAIRLHNKLALPEGLDGRTRTLSQILRDADKADIFRVMAEIPMKDRRGVGQSSRPLGNEMSPGVLECVMAHSCVPHGVRRSVFDGDVSHCCLAFELEYPESRRIVREQGFLLQLLEQRHADGMALGNDLRREQLNLVRREIEAAWGMQL